MKDLFAKIDAKVLKESGSLLIAGFLAYTLYKILTNDLSHLNNTLGKVNDTLEKNNEIQRQTATAIEGNTRTLENIQFILRR